MARDLGRFVSEARRSIDEFKEELTAGADDDEDEENEREKRSGSS
jgi:Sec-independent protein translocase protein TatA